MLREVLIRDKSANACFGRPAKPDSPFPRHKRHNSTTHDLMDMNGDGVLDRVIKAYATSSMTVYPGKVSAKSDSLIRTITNSLGGTRLYTYHAIPKSDDFFNQTNPYYKPKRLVVATVTSDNGFGNQETVSYDYLGGLYEAATREDYGFKTIHMTEQETGMRHERHYYQDEEDGLFAGRLKRELTRGPSFVGNTGPTVSYTAFDYEDLTRRNGDDYGCDISQLRPGSGPEVRVKSIKVTHSDTYLVDGTTSQDVDATNTPGGSQWKQTHRDLTYTNYGQIATDTRFGDYAAGFGDNSRTETVTDYTQTADWTFLPVRVTTFAVSEAGGFALSGDTRYTYTSSGLPKTRTETKGPGSTACTSLTYDACGNIATLTDPNQHTTSFTYDSRYCAYPVTETAPPVNGITFVTETAYDDLMRPLTVTDPNGRETTTTYDGFGRVVSLVTPGDPLDTPTVSTHYAPYQPDEDGEIARPASHDTQRKDGPRTITYVDGFGNQVQTKTTGVDENNTTQWRTVDVWRTIEAQQRVVTTSETYLSPDSGFDRPATPEEGGKALAFVRSWFDAARGRVTETEVDPIVKTKIMNI